jgi:conjugal transfer pilus assembly protein TraW
MILILVAKAGVSLVPILRKRIILFTLVWLLATNSDAKLLGTLGTVFPIAEPDLLQMIQSRVALLSQHHRFDWLQAVLDQGFQQAMDRPIPVVGLSLATKSRTWVFDPSITLSPDFDYGTQLFTPQRINPLDTLSLKEALLFYDADDNRQVQWAERTDQSLQGKTKLILVGGSVKSQEKRFHKRVYFDQGGCLKNRFQLNHVPTMITQQDNLLKIQEVTLP